MGEAYLEFEIPVRSWSLSDREVLSAKLSLIGFESFMESDHLLYAYICEHDFSPPSLNGLIDEFRMLGRHLQYRYHKCPEQNWNTEWEKNYMPVVIGGKVLVRAPFHDGTDDFPLTLVIEPKMSFGTGHHHTTHLMIEAILRLDLKGKQILDMGCGTGILGILASRLGAGKVVGVDNDQWAFENANENMERNQMTNLEIRLGDSTVLGNDAYHYIFANITRNTLVSDIPVYARHLLDGGGLLLSGFLSEDVQFILNAAYQEKLEHRETYEKENWISLFFVKPQVSHGRK
jgi:ribosomal protein L11 methyltransferase